MYLPPPLCRGNPTADTHANMSHNTIQLESPRGRFPAGNQKRPQDSDRKIAVPQPFLFGPVFTVREWM